MEHHFPWQLIEKVSVYSKKIYQQVINTLPADGHRPIVEQRDDWYYR
ncbi:MAG: DUF4433 domain-containing protein [Chloroflexi bacterium]|nr:DUF4433 domain-containing protein [Chloroflexota bacterium]